MNVKILAAFDTLKTILIGVVGGLCGYYLFTVFGIQVVAMGLLTFAFLSLLMVLYQMNVYRRTRDQEKKSKPE